MKQLKIVVIGAGSSYTPEFIEGLLKRWHALPVGELWLVDIEDGKEKLAIITALTKRMIAKSGVSIEVFETIDLEKALPNADFVTTQIRVGLLKARAFDECIPLAHGVLGQETNGIGGFFKALRTVPVLLHIATFMNKLCPSAWLINFTNPASIVTQALYQHGEHKKVVGVCNVPISMKKAHINSLSLDDATTVFHFIGLNHNVFLCDVKQNHRSIMPLILEDFIASTNKVVENIDPILWEPDFVRALNAVPCPYHRYYLKASETLSNNIEKFNNHETRAEKVLQIEQELFQLYQDPNLSEKPSQLAQRGGAYYSDVACNLISSIYNDTQDVQTLNVPNNGTIPFLSNDDIIECSCYVGKNGFCPVGELALPHGTEGLIFDIKMFERLAVEVAVSGDRDKALVALTMNRLVSDDAKAKIIFDQLLEVNRNYLPQFFGE